MKGIIHDLQKRVDLETLGCCCGHGRYPTTIVVRIRASNHIIEYYSGIHLADKPRSPKRYYVKDGKGYYYIPEVEKIKFGWEAT